MFDHVRVPRENLLNRFADVAPDGTYSSEIENANRRFFTMLGTLVRGRVTVGGSAAQAARVALDIAVRYALQRKQFKAPGEDREVPIMDYLMHQRRLLPFIAQSYALQFAQNELVSAMHDHQTAAVLDLEAQRDIEARAAGLKHLFVLTTRTGHWFLKRGFNVGTVDDLPRTKKNLYNWQRKSQVLLKPLN
jgi:acyl-CoA oxidase